MFDFLFSYGGYAPHGYCIAWDPLLLWSHIGADTVIAISYLALPVLIVWFLRKRQEPALNAPAAMFALFIFFCGLSHLAGILTFFYPAYGLQALIKVATAIISAISAVVVIALMPSFLRIPAPRELFSAIAAHTSELSHRKKVETELRDTLARLQTTNTELRELAYAASHDLKSPSIAVLYWLESFAEDQRANYDEYVGQELQEVTSHVRRMSQKTADVLELSQLLTAPEQPSEPVPLNQVVEMARARILPLLQESGARMSVDALPTVSGQASTLVILLEQLFQNAIKFQAPDTVPRIKVSSHPDPDAPGRVILRVCDNGIGIADQHRERVFGIFARLNAPEDYAGTGMGLALCRRVAALHGGRIWAEACDELGGTCMHVSLALADMEELPLAA